MIQRNKQLLNSYLNKCLISRNLIDKFKLIEILKFNIACNFRNNVTLKRMSLHSCMPGLVIQLINNWLLLSDKYLNSKTSCTRLKLVQVQTYLSKQILKLDSLTYRWLANKTRLRNFIKSFRKSANRTEPRSETKNWQSTLDYNFRKEIRWLLRKKRTWKLRGKLKLTYAKGSPGTNRSTAILKTTNIYLQTISM